jgi:hypothetical protein
MRKFHCKGMDVIYIDVELDGIRQTNILRAMERISVICMINLVKARVSIR